jgi:hypothetical protein
LFTDRVQMALVFVAIDGTSSSSSRAFGVVVVFVAKKRKNFCGILVTTGARHGLCLNWNFLQRVAVAVVVVVVVGVNLVFGNDYDDDGGKDLCWFL